MTFTPSMARSIIEQLTGIEPVLSQRGPRKDQHVKYAYRFKFNGPTERHISISTRATEDGVTIYTNQRSTNKVLFPDGELRPARVTKTYPKGSTGKTGDKGLSTAAAGLPTLNPKDNDVLRLSVPSEAAFRRILGWYFGKSPEAASSIDVVAADSLAKEMLPSTVEIPSAQRLDKEIEVANKEGSPEEEIQLRAIRTRRGQPKFREKVLSAYERRCAITGCNVEDVLEAAHIVPHSEETDWDVTNGLALRADIHTLFDLKLLTVADDYRVHVSRQLAESEYGKLDGLSIALPKTNEQRPDRDKLARLYREFLQCNPGNAQ